MATTRSLQQCFNFVLPISPCSPEGVAQIESAAVNLRDAETLELNGRRLRVNRADFEGLIALLASNAKVFVRLCNGNWVVPLSLAYEGGEVAEVTLYDPLANTDLLTVSTVQFLPQWSGVLVVIDEAGASVAEDGAGQFELKKIYRSYQYLLGPILVSGLMANVMSLASPFFFMLLLDKVVSYQAWSTLTALVVGATIILCFESVFGHLRGIYTGRVLAEFGTGATEMVFRRTTHHPVELYEARPVAAWFEENGTAARFVKLVQKLATGATDYAFALIFLVVLLWLSWQLTLVAVLTALLQIAFAFVFGNKRDNLRRDAAESNTRAEGILLEVLSNLKTVKILGLLTAKRRQYSEALHEAARQRYLADRNESLHRAGSSLIERTGNIVMLAAGAAMVMQSTMSVGALVASNLLMRRVTGPLVRLPQVLNDLREIRRIRLRWANVAKAPVEQHARQSSSIIEYKRIIGRIEFRKVYFRYGGRSGFQLMLDTEMPAGRSYAVVGPSGSGKTTLANLIVGLHSPHVGAICIDGNDLRELDLNAVRQQIGVVSHDFGLFRGTIRSNITSGDPSVTFERVQAAASLASLHESVLMLPAGYESLVGEAGHNLSAGQRTRVSLARALVRDPAVLLLDEVTGDLDPATERSVVAGLIQGRKGRTTIFLTHSEVVASQVDIVYFLGDGRLLGVGSHAELLSKNPAYRTFWGV